MNKVKANISNISAAMQNENSCKENEAREVVELLKNKPTFSVGDSYEMFGTTYVAVKDKEQCCDNCVFRDANCMFNVDVPCCDNGVVFKKLSSVKLVIWDSAINKVVAEVKQITDGMIETTDGQKCSIARLLDDNLIIKSIIA